MITQNLSLELKLDNRFEFSVENASRKTHSEPYLFLTAVHCNQNIRKSSSSRIWILSSTLESYETLHRLTLYFSSLKFVAEHFKTNSSHPADGHFRTEHLMSVLSTNSYLFNDIKHWKCEQWTPEKESRKTTGLGEGLGKVRFRICHDSRMTRTIPYWWTTDFGRDYIQIGRWVTWEAVSYTHLTLPTIYSV